MGILQIIGSILLVIGWVFALTGSLGVLRMPDFYSRLHPAGMTDSFAQGLIVLGLVLFTLQDLIPAAPGPDEPLEHAPDLLATVGTVDTALKLVLLIAMIYLASPTATHAISKAARLDHFTKIPVEGDLEDTRMTDIVVAGDTYAELEERPSEVFNVDDDKPADESEDKPADDDKGEA
jgi:multicomponent Na+:H+ antiporter subunit G